MNDAPSVLWFRRDLRLADNPALLAALDDARRDHTSGTRGETVPLFVLDPALWCRPTRCALTAGYGEERNRAALDRTSYMSVHLKRGVIHPRTMLADLAGRSAAASTYRTELGWREFYADVLWRRPDTAREYLKREFAAMEYDELGADFDAWRDGRTGYPIVDDAGVRQLRTEGWLTTGCG